MYKLNVIYSQIGFYQTFGPQILLSYTFIKKLIKYTNVNI